MSDNKNMKEKISALEDGELSDLRPEEYWMKYHKILNTEISGAVFSKLNFHLKNQMPNF